MKTLSTLVANLRCSAVAACVIGLLTSSITARAQGPAAPDSLTLAAVVAQAQGRAAVGQQARTNRETGYWAYRAYQANYRPQLGLTGVLPNFNHQITPVVQPDGTLAFKSVRNNNSTLGVAVTQNIGLTGGQVVLGSQVQRVDNFNDSTKQYNNQPFTLGFTQPIGYFNPLRWARAVEPLRYRESQRQYAEDRETVAQRATELYFDVLVQQVNAAVAAQNARATAELLRVGQERYRLGRLSQSDLIQLELNLLNAQQAQTQAGLDAENAAVALAAYAGLPGPQAGAIAALAVPVPAPAPPVVPTDALAQARQHRAAPLAFQRRLLLAARDVAYARGTTGFQATLLANLGYVNQADRLSASYLSLQNQQQVSLAFSLPLVDWGRRHSLVRTAELNRDQEQRNVAQDEATFAQTVLAQARQLGPLGQQVGLAARADSLAQRRYAITRATYEAGRLSLTDLIIAQAAKDGARRGYILALRAGWVAHYRLRALTLYDFDRQVALSDDPS
ncbi:TolC family protein [Hymenobacter nivis]|uniref:TolC family protein n=1 Tax=Hymenobacter nivis TaxID=1850093 RepID=A0A502GU89_9BACT|nr:TolC family protein [Hymenobacter nivis]TPG64523.1 TolC family protein [Hymenobacter nivis]